MKTSDVVKSPHDKFFKSVLSDKSLAMELIESYVPKTIRQLTDISSIQLMPNSFIDERLKKRESDILYEAKFNGETGYFYFLIEHQSTPDSKMPLRCARYITLIQEQHMKTHKTSTAPYVYPMVFYNGKEAYKYPTDIREMINAPKELLDDYRLAQFQLIDLNAINDEKMRTSTWVGLNLFAMKHAYDRELESVFRTIIRSLELLEGAFPRQIFLSRQMGLFCYIMSTYRTLDREEFMQSLQQSQSETLKSAGLTIAEQLKEIGLEQGLEQGFQASQRAIARNMLRSGFKITQVSELTGMSTDQVEKLTEEQLAE